MKPRICFRNGMWRLTFGYHPRMMWLFGMDAQERRTIIEGCVLNSDFATLIEAFQRLKCLYREGSIRRESAPPPSVQAQAKMRRKYPTIPILYEL